MLPAVRFTILALVAALALGADGVRGQASDSTADSGLSPEVEAIPLCTQPETLAASTLLQTNERKKQCETRAGIEELTMVANNQALCDITSCKAALKALYTELPNCRFEAFAFQYGVLKQLQNCGIDPTDPKDADAWDTYGSGSDSDVGSMGGSGSEEPTPTPADWGSDSTSSETFAPIGLTPAPKDGSSDSSSSSTPTPTDGASTALISSAAVMVVASVSTALAF